MSLFCNGPGRTPVNASAAGAVGVEETIRVMVSIGTGCWINGQFCHNRPCAHGFALFGNQAVTQPEGSQAGSSVPSSIVFSKDAAIKSLIVFVTHSPEILNGSAMIISCKNLF